MTLKEMQACAAQTLMLFTQSMPDVPFGADGVVIEFVTKKNIVERFKALCAQYAPDRPITEEHCRQLENTVFANAITGRVKSAVVIRIDYKNHEDNLRRIVFHELMHIYCGKTEMDTEHFIDTYGSGHTPDTNPEDKEYDGYVNAGYSVWSEFIAEYTAVVKTSPWMHTYADIADYTNQLLCESVIGNDGAKASFSVAAAYILSSSDADDLLDGSDGSEVDMICDMSRKEKAEKSLLNCLRHLYRHIHTEKPWKINEEFIYDLGCKYLWFLTNNSLSLGMG